jgi:hypothetical protein
MNERLGYKKRIILKNSDLEEKKVNADDSRFQQSQQLAYRYKSKDEHKTKMEDRYQ